MKKIFNVLVLALAFNFLLAAGAAGWLYRAARVDKEKLAALKAVLFPPPPADAAATQPTGEAPTTRPMFHLEELLAQRSGLSAAEQLQFMQQTFDVQSAQLDRRHRELLDLERQVDLANKKLSADRVAFEGEKNELAAREQEAARLAGDKGFQDSLKLYTQMPGRQAKKVFLSLDDDTVVRYLRAMGPRPAAKIVKEFKTPEELDRIQVVLEKMRQARPEGAAPQDAPPQDTPPGGDPARDGPPGTDVPPQASTKE